MIALSILIVFLVLAYFAIFKGKSRSGSFQKPFDYDTIIIGGGVCGATLSNALASLGKKVLLIERDLSNQERFVGEVLQPCGVKKLKELGLEDCLEGIDSQVVNGYGISYKDFKKVLNYPNEDKGRSYHHAKFVKNIRERALKNENVKIINGSVTKLIEEEGKIVGVAYSTKESSENTVIAPLTFVCSGINSIFRESLNKSEPVVSSHFIALILKDVNSKILFPDYGNVLLEERPILMYPISSTEVRVLIDYKVQVPSNVNGELSKFLQNDVAKLIPESLKEAFNKAIESGNVKHMPNRTLNATPYEKDGVFLLGDSLNCRHPLTGGGQSVIFSDICILKKLLQNVDFRNYDQMKSVTTQFHSERVGVAATINILANALYQIFSSQDSNMDDMKNAVLQYFNLGGVCVTGPMGFLSGTDSRPYYLLVHFFAVAIYGFLIMFYSSPLSIILALNLVYKAVKLVLPIIGNEGFLKILKLDLF